MDLIEGLVLGFHLAVDAVEVLGAAADFGVDAGGGELRLQLIDDQLNDVLALLALGAHQLDQLVIALRVDIAQREILHLPFYGEYAQPVRQRGVHVQRLAGDGHLPLGLLVFERAHIVQPVGQLDQHDADVLAHGQEHLAQRFGLLLLAGGEVQPA